MNKYKVVVETIERYELFVEANDIETAKQIGRDTDLDDYEATGVITITDTVSEVLPITEQDNINA
jgi:hypothetical protein